MNKQKTIYAGITRTIWGYFFVYFDFKIGTLSVTPKFIGIWLFLSAIDLLKDEQQDMELLRPFANILLLWNFAEWAAAWGGISIQEYFPLISAIVGIINMYFHFQLMTDFAALANRYAPADSMIESTLLIWRSIQTVLLTCITLIGYMESWNFKYKEAIQFWMAIIYVFAGIFVIWELFSLRKVFLEDEE